MDKRLEENLLRWMIRILIVIFLILIVLRLMNIFSVPGLNPIVFFLIWVAQWRLFYIRGVFPGKIYTFIYSLIALLAAILAVRQILP